MKIYKKKVLLLEISENICKLAIFVHPEVKTCHNHEESECFNPALQPPTSYQDTHFLGSFYLTSKQQKIINKTRKPPERIGPEK